MPSMNGNTEGFDFSQWANADQNSLAGIINKESNRANYGALLSDRRLEEVRKMLFRMVQRWDEQDIRAIVADYGDASLIQGRMSKNKLCKQAVETIIINMDPDELEALAKKTKYRIAGLRVDIKKYDSAANKRGKTALLDMMQSYQNIKDTKNYRQYKKGLKAEGSIKPGKILKGNYRTLTRELDEYLKTFDVLALRNLAAELGIEINEDDRITPKILKQEIINLVCLYVDIITGKNKNIHYGNAITNPSGIQELLKYTSFGFLSGNPGMTPAEGRRLREQARRNKMMIDMRLKMMKKRSSINSRAFKELAGQSGEGMFGYSATAKNIAKNDTGVLKDCSLDQLLDLAVNYGINPKTRNIGKLKLEIYRAMAAESKEIKRLEKGHGAGNRDKLAVLKNIQSANTQDYSNSSEDGGIVSVLSKPNDPARDTSGPISQIDFIASDTLDKFKSVTAILPTGPNERHNVCKMLFDPEALARTIEPKSEPLKMGMDFGIIMTYMFANLKIKLEYLREAVTFKSKSGNGIIDPTINPAQVFVSTDNESNPQEYRLHDAYAIYLTYIYLIATKQAGAAEIIRSRYGLIKKTYKQIIRLKDRIKMAVKDKVKDILKTVGAPILGLIRFGKSLGRLMSKDKKQYKTKESLNPADLGFLNELESQTIGGLKEICARKLQINLGGYKNKDGKDMPSFDTVYSGLSETQQKGILMYMIAKMMKRHAVCKYLEYSLDFANLISAEQKKDIENRIKVAKRKPSNLLKSIFSFKGIKDKFRRSGFGDSRKSGVDTAKKLTSGVSDTTDGAISLDDDSPDNPEPVQPEAEAEEGPIKTILTMIDASAIIIGDVDITDSVVNLFSIFSTEENILSYQNFLNIFNSENETFSGLTNFLEAFADEDIRLGFSNFWTSMSFEEVWGGMTNFYNMFKSYNDADGAFFDILVEKLKHDDDDDNPFKAIIDLFSNQDVITGLTNMLTVMSFDEVHLGMGCFYEIFNNSDNVTAFTNMINLFSSDSIDNIFIGTQNFFNMFNNETFVVGIQNFADIFSLESVQILKQDNFWNGMYNFFSTFESNQSWFNSFKNMLNIFDISTMSSSDASLISLGMTSFFSAFIYTGKQIEILNKGIYNFTNIFSQYKDAEIDFMRVGLYNNLFMYSLFSDADLVDINTGMGNFYKMFVANEYNMVNDVHEILTILKGDNTSENGDGSTTGNGNDNGRGHDHRGFVGPGSFEETFAKELAMLKARQDAIDAQESQYRSAGLSDEEVEKSLSGDMLYQGLKAQQQGEQAKLDEARSVFESSRKNTNFDHGIEASRYISKEAKALRITRVRKAIADPVYVVNFPDKEAEMAVQQATSMAIAEQTSEDTTGYLQAAMPLSAASNAGLYTPGAIASIAGLLALQAVQAGITTAGAMSGLTGDLQNQYSAYARGSNKIKGSRRNSLAAFARGSNKIKGKTLNIPAFASGANKYTNGAYKSYLNKAKNEAKESEQLHDDLINGNTQSSNVSRMMDRTSFISGDTLDGGGNPELVSIDWHDRSASVKPIPEDVSFKPATSGVMSQYERKLPMSVSIKNNLVKYNNMTFPSNITDDGSGAAVKTYQINNPLTENINVNGKETSIFELIVLIADTLNTISAGVATNASINQVIAQNTANLAHGGSQDTEPSGSFTSAFDDILQGM